MMEFVSLDEIKKEIDILKQIKHPYITKLVDAGHWQLLSRDRLNEVYCVVVETPSGGGLFDFISMTGAVSEDVTRYYFNQLLNALQHLHENGISNRDLKIENILLDKDFNLKIADFGNSPSKSDDHIQASSLDCIAPEISKRVKFEGKMADIFRAGFILFMMHAQTKPFSEALDSDPLYKYISSNRSEKFWKLHCKQNNESFFTEEFKDLVNILLSDYPVHRCSIAEIRSHPWFNGTIDVAEYSNNKLNSEINKQCLRIITEVNRKVCDCKF